MRTLSIFTPSGSFGIGMLMVCRELSADSGTPLLLTSLTWSSWPLSRDTRQVADPVATSRFRLALTSSGPAADRVRPDELSRLPSGPSFEFRVWAREPKVTSTEPLSWSTVPLENPPLRCVSSGYLSHGYSCRATIPTGVVTDAWAREQRAGVPGDQFFHFTWRAEVWLAFGLSDGRIRGVYCPEHSAEREQHALDCQPGEEGALASIALTG